MMALQLLSTARRCIVIPVWFLIGFNLLLFARLLQPRISISTLHSSNAALLPKSFENLKLHGRHGRNIDNLNGGQIPVPEWHGRKTQTQTVVQKRGAEHANVVERGLPDPGGTLDKRSRAEDSHKHKHSNHISLSDFTSLKNTHTLTVIDDKCSDGLCLELLSKEDLEKYENCSTPTPRATPIQGKCHFMDGRHRPPVALASFPGSGNTWVRGLLEQATGICTGSVYCDRSLRVKGLNGEGLTSGSVLVTKTHMSSCNNMTQCSTMKTSAGYNNKKLNTKAMNEVPLYGASILLIRNPYGTLVSEWTRRTSSRNTSNRHTANTSTKKQFMYNERWNNFTRIMLHKWKTLYCGWIANGHRMGYQLLVVRYEDVKADSFHEVKRMLNFLKISYNENELRDKMAEDFNTFRRKHSGEEFDHFTPQQSSLVRDTITKTIDYLKQHNHGDTLKLEEYLTHTRT